MKIHWMTNLFLWGSVFPILPIEYFLLRDESKRKKNIVVGVTLPYEAQRNTDVQQRLQKYQRELNRVFLFLLAIILPCCWIPSLGMMMFAWGVWILLAIVLPNIPYARCHRDLREIKHRNGWSHQPNTVRWVDTAALPKEKWYSPWLFVPATVLCLLPIVWDTQLVAVYASNAICVFCCWLGYRYLYRNRAEMVDANTDLSQVLTHIRRRNWGKVWLYCAYSLAAINLATWLVVQETIVALTLILFFSVLFLCAAVRIEFVTRRVQEKLTAESGKEWYVDEDDKWIFGIFYYNPHDTRTLINTRVGINHTFNLARPAGKVLLVFTVLTMLSIPFLGIFINSIGNQPLALDIHATAIVASHGNSRYEVALEDIDTITLLDTLPQGLHRVAGTGMENLRKGRFRSPEFGNMTLCLDPQCPPFLLIQTTDGRHFLFGTRDATLSADTVAELLPK